MYGLSVSTATTLQTENKFYSVEWEKIETVLKSVDVLLDSYPVEIIKIGIYINIIPFIEICIISTARTS